MKWYSLRHVDGNFTIITPPTVLDGNGQLYQRLVRAHHLELHKAIAGRPIWAPEDFAIPLYEDFKIYFQKLGALLNPPIDTDLLDPISRHLFFVCTEPFKNNDGQLQAGLSELEKLMGYSYAISNEPLQLPKHTTGETDLDLLVDSVLIFKTHGITMAQMLGVEDLSKACVQANNRMRVSAPDDDGSEKQPEPRWEDDPEYQDHEDEILAALGELGVKLPYA